MSGKAIMLADIEVLTASGNADHGVMRVSACLNLAGHLPDRQYRQLVDAMERRVPVSITIDLPEAP